MSLKSLPLVYVNLGGEMIYILHQRLQAQQIEASKAKKVLQDIVSTMFNKTFLDEMFKPQDPYHRRALRTMFDRLAHASIMRLNTASMDKLYDLMTMAFKYQVSLAPQPRDLLLITLNHVDGIRNLLEPHTSAVGHLDGLYHQLMQTYEHLSHGEFALIRSTLLTFFQDTHVRVSIFLKEKQQDHHGVFMLPKGGRLPYGYRTPGEIRIYERKEGSYRKSNFNAIQRYIENRTAPSFDMLGDRQTELGKNMYILRRDTADPMSTGGRKIVSRDSTDMDGFVSDPTAKAQLDMLSHLIGGSKATSANKNFRLNLFSTDEEEEVAATAEPVIQEPEVAGQVFTIDARKRDPNHSLAGYLKDLDVSGNKAGNQQDDDDDDDLLNLMDQAA